MRCSSSTELPQGPWHAHREALLGTLMLVVSTLTPVLTSLPALHMQLRISAVMGAFSQPHWSMSRPSWYMSPWQGP